MGQRMGRAVCAAERHGTSAICNDVWRREWPPNQHHHGSRPVTLHHYNPFKSNNLRRLCVSQGIAKFDMIAGTNTEKTRSTNAQDSP
ncbi:hypothetical protein XACJK2_460034 [Xanthomonas citri pv. citri]|nr:hypothetical protein XACJK2_460034 [Xanthomonas citri pv. citri]